MKNYDVYGIGNALVDTEYEVDDAFLEHAKLPKGIMTLIEEDDRQRLIEMLENEHEIIAYLAGRMKKNRIRTLVGDRATIEMTPYDLDKGRIIYRHKDERAPSTRAQQRKNFRRR